MHFSGVELNGVPSYVGRMKKFFRKILNRFRSKPSQQEIDDLKRHNVASTKDALPPTLAQFLADIDNYVTEEEVRQTAMAEALLHSEWEENILTAGRPVTLFPPSRTLH